MDLTTIIITKNAGDTIADTLQSMQGLGSRIVVVDEYSIDDTVHIAYEHGAEVVQRQSLGYADQRRFALTLVKTEWVLILDCDEVLTKQNKLEIHEALSSGRHDGYRLKFRNHLFGKRLTKGELHEKLVLFRLTKSTVTNRTVHETYEVEGSIGELPSEVIHNSYRTPLQILKKFIKYSFLEAKEMKKKNIKWGIRELFLNPLHMLYARFIKDDGYKDGLPRLFLDSAFAGMEFLSYALIPFVKTKKRIAVDCGSYPVGGSVRSGIGRLLQGIYSYQSNKLNYYWFGFDKKAKNRLPTVLFSQFWLPLAAIFNRCDIFLGVSGVIPALLRRTRIQKILFLYDFGFLKSPELYVGSAVRLKKQTEDSILIADKIVFLHKDPYKEFILRYPSFCYKATIIPSGADHLQDIQEIPVFIQPKKPIFLSVGVVKPVKKTELLLEVVGDAYTIIAGPEEDDYAKKLWFDTRMNIQRIQGFNDGQLKWLYKHSDALINTSESEGFCYPVLEALTLGVPVIAFDLPLFREYKKYFSYLTLVSDKQMMKDKLKEDTFKKHISPIHPYRWETFALSLFDLTETNRMHVGSIQKIGIIVVLYKTSQVEISRLGKEILAMKFDDCVLYWIDNSENGKGYATGINEGIRRGLADGCTHFIAMNPDISLQKLNAENIKEAAEKFDVWGYAMQQEKMTYYGGEIDRWRLSGGLTTKKPKKRYSIIDFVSASIICFTKEVIQSIGLWDESYFMYYEDVDFCIRAKKRGYRVGIDSEAIYTHFEVSQLNKKKDAWIAKSRWRFFWKYANSEQKMRELVRLPKTLLGK